MAKKRFAVDINLNLNKLLSGLIYPLSTSDRNALTLSTQHAGLLSYDINLNQLYAWNGTAWGLAVTPSSGAMTYKGSYTSLTVAPSGTNVGDTYVFTGTAGTLTWPGITFSPSAVVQVGDLLVKRDASDWDVIQGNVVLATTSVAGIIQLATSAEVITGTDANKAVTPATLASWRLTKGICFSYGQNGISLTAATPFTITHNLNLALKDDFIIRCYDSSGNTINLSSDSVDINSLTITSSINLTNVGIFVLGLSN